MLLETRLPALENATSLPAVGLEVVTVMRATGPPTAATARPASSIPAPQKVVLQ